MKMLFLTSLLAFSSAMASTGQIGSGSNSFNVQNAIEKSKQFKSIKKSYEKVGGSFTCSDYKIVADTDLEPVLSGYTLRSKSVIAVCAANPNDGGDAIYQRLLSIVTVSESSEFQLLNIEVRSVVTVTPAQPD